ncbi:MAG: uracil-DNA glycosylase [Deltaproteobacteria bacterium]|nr:uracil-DNA glycosylase [Deltaproteobacteria bacterium]
MHGEGPKGAEVMLVGQNPGREEVKQRRPFVGRAGQYLNKVLQQYGLDRGSLYLTGVVKEGTPHNRKPTAREINRWMPTLEAEIKTVKPALIVLMGRVAWKTPRFEGIDYMETYHPAAAMRFPKIREKFERDMGRLRQMIIQRGLKGVS